MSASHKGTCHICGTYGPLSFEHVPPRAVQGGRPVVMVSDAQAFSMRPGVPAPKGRLQRKGMGGYTLCERCNSLPGHWYGAEFSGRWTVRALEVMAASDGKPSLIHLYHLFPLRVIKQVITMFFSVNSDRFHEAHPELVAFVLNKERRYLPPQYQLYVYYNYDGQLRSQSVAGKVELVRGDIQVFSEITYPPFGYVLSFDSTPPSPHLFNITHFATYGYYEFDSVQLKPPVLPTHLVLPGDYRTETEILEQIARSELETAQRDAP